MPGRACMVVHEYFPRDFRVRREARALCDAGWSVDIICLRQPGQKTTEKFEDLRIVRLPVRRHRGYPLPVYLAEYTAFAAAAGTVLTARHTRNPYDVVHVHAPPDFLVGAGLTTRLAGAKLVLDIHDLTPELYGSRFRSTGGALAKGVMHLVERGSCAVANRVITVTEAFRRLLCERGVDPDKIVVVHNCPDPEAFRPAERKPDRKGFSIIHHGTLVHRYGVDVLVEAFAKVASSIPGSRLDIYGEGDWLPKLRERIEDDSLGSRVNLHGEVSQQEVAQALARADLCVVPNRKDEFTDLLLPTKLLEALHMGCPVIASETRVIAETFADGGVVLVPPGDAKALASSIEFLASHREDLANLSVAGRGQAERFSWVNEKKKLIGLYDDLTPSPS